MIDVTVFIVEPLGDYPVRIYDLDNLISIGFRGGSEDVDLTELTHLLEELFEVGTD